MQCKSLLPSHQSLQELALLCMKPGYSLEPVWKGSIVRAKEDCDHIRWRLALCKDLLKYVGCPSCIVSTVSPGDDICLCKHQWVGVRDVLEILPAMRYTRGEPYGIQGVLIVRPAWGTSTNWVRMTLRWYALASRAPQPPSSNDRCVKLSPNSRKVFLDIPYEHVLEHS